MKKIIFGSANENKVQEIRAKLDGVVQVLSLNDIGFKEEIEEYGATLEENARIKAETIYQKYKRPVFSDDTGLEIESLNNEPGVRSARYAGEPRSDEKNMQLVLRRLESYKNRKAKFRTVFCLIDEDGKAHYLEGVAKGSILKEKRGEKGFGYDPIFMPEGYAISFAEMSQDEKNQISHRGKAVDQLVNFLKNENNVD
ncbi:MAG: RdgB/HAM1 family non-canonical purine NTP pyrophosphatase [Cyclobacteriaceae bacterium]|nr:RdgB/HAM1 family non-canonical purine NTP pyrophosphatase [Cyclobacteriaceae bacterium]MCH8515094.1 RdgB/HAM1 family non-canonical purine NTP pyrophosphatase [Cyclobacteriaceae bacterium]